MGGKYYGSQRQAIMNDWIDLILTTLALPQYGLSSVFVVSFLGATLLPLASEPAVFGLIKINSELFWPTIVAATCGNTLGGSLSWWMGWGTHQIAERARRSPVQIRALNWLQRLGAKACLFSFLPVIGDPLCFLAGWLRFPFWTSFFYMLVGKFLRYLVMTSLLLWMLPGRLPSIGN
jgi:membrane protein YqaA with SNARE-associated domain